MKDVYASRTFANLTLKDRMPRILTQVVDTVNREEKNLVKQHLEVSTFLQKTTTRSMQECCFSFVPFLSYHCLGGAAKVPKHT